MNNHTTDQTVQAIRKVVSLLSPDATVLNYSDPITFSEMWSSIELDTRAYGTPVIVVWDAEIDDPIFAPVQTARILTPFEWAACAAFASPEKRFLILPLRGKGGKSLPLYDFYLKLDPNKVSWLRLTTILSFLEDLARLLGSGGVYLPTAVTPLDFLNHLRSVLIQLEAPIHRHSLSNILAPLLLRDDSMIITGPSELPTSPHPGIHHIPLRNLFHILKETTRSPGYAYQKAPLTVPIAILPDTRFPTYEPDKQTPYLFVHNIRAILVDDQADQGWADWLHRLITSASPATVDFTVYKDPREELIPRLRSLLTTARDWTFNLSLVSTSSSNESQKDNPDEILFLDLRFFPDNVHAMKDIILQTLNLVSTLDIPNKANDLSEARQLHGVPDPSELEQVRAWCESNNENTECEEAISGLTLLPRLIACIDYSYPIILFSSTGQRRVIDRLTRYGNIITEFSKPSLVSLLYGDSVFSVESKLIEALYRAAIFLSGRRLIKAILEHGRVIDGVRRSYESSIKLHGNAGQDIENQKRGHIEIYIDESGSAEERQFRIGGLLVAFKDLDSANQMNISMEEKGLLFRGDTSAFVQEARRTPGRGPIDEKVKMTIRNLAIDIRDKVRETLDDYECAIIPFLFNRPKDATLSGLDPSDLTNPEAMDNVFTSCLRDCLESLIAEVAPLLGGPGKQTCRVIVATRQRVFGVETLADTWEDLYRKWRIVGSQRTSAGWKDVINKDNGSIMDNYGREKSSYQSIRPESVYTILGDVLSRRVQLDRLPRIEAAYGFRLEYHPNPREPKMFCRNLHYVADLVAHCGQGNVFSRFKNTWLGGVVENCGGGFNSKLNASRAIDRGDTVEALLQMSRLADEEWSTSVSRAIILRLAACVRGMSPGEFMRFASLHGMESSRDLPPT